MKKHLAVISAFFLSILSLTAQQRVVASYVTSWSSVMPDPALLTHVNYAFGHVKDSFDGVRIDNPDRLRAIVALKEQNPDLKVILSIGGWGSGNFSEMAASRRFRRSFAKDCARACREFSLDGIDIDWEYPGEGAAAKISFSPDDKTNFNLLMRDLRRALGRRRLLTLASCCDPRYIDFATVMRHVDFVNLMTYDMGRKDKFHCALHASANTGRWTTEASVEAHIAAGVPATRLVMGVPFYGRGSVRPSRGNDFKDIYPLESQFVEKWDEVACAPYLVDASGQFVFGFENARSLRIKCDYIREKGLLGIMNWDYDGDDDSLTLTRIMHTLAE